MFLWDLVIKILETIVQFDTFYWSSFASFYPLCGLTFGCLQFSLPMPQGGRDAITKNLILREDQLPQKYLYPRNKKKVNKEVSGFSLF